MSRRSAPRRRINYQLSSSGGIAQLVERQLCKLEVRGSNPLASSLRSRRRVERRLSRRSLGEGGPFHLVDANAASYDSASQRAACESFSTSIFCRVSATRTDSTLA